MLSVAVAAIAAAFLIFLKVIFCFQAPPRQEPASQQACAVHIQQTKSLLSVHSTIIYTKRLEREKLRFPCHAVPVNLIISTKPEHDSATIVVVSIPSSCVMCHFQSAATAAIVAAALAHILLVLHHFNVQFFLIIRFTCVTHIHIPSKPA